MVFAETSVGLDAVAGGGVTAMLVAVMIAFLRRTKETDDRRDASMQLVVDAARAERDRVLADRDAARREADRIRVVWEEDRRRFDELRKEHDHAVMQRDTALAAIEQLRIQIDVERQRKDRP